MGAPFRPGNRDDVVSVCEYPSVRQLCCGATLVSGDRFNTPDQFEVARKVIVLEPRRYSSVVVLGKVLVALDLACKKSATQRTVSDKRNAQFPHRSQNFVLRLPTPE